MKKNGFVSKNLYGLKDKLQKTDENIIEQKPEVNTSSYSEALEKECIPNNNQNDNSQDNKYNKIKIKNENKHPVIEKPPVLQVFDEKEDKELKKALKEKKEEYLRTKKHVVEKVTNTINKLPARISKIERELKELKSAEQQIKEATKEINAINEKDWDNNDYSTQLREASKTVENARLQHIMLSAKLSSLDEENSSKTTTDNNSIIPELTSLKFFQLFKIGFGFTFPLILGLVLTGIIISVVIFFVMGGF